MSTRPAQATQILRWLLALFAFGLFAAATPARADLAANPSTVALTVGKTASVALSGARGPLTATSSAPGVATAALTNLTNSSATLVLTGITAGNATVSVRDTRNRVRVSVTVQTPPMTISPSSLSLVAGTSALLTASYPAGTLTASSGNTAVATATVLGNTVTVRGVAPGSTQVTVRDGRTTLSVPVTVTAPALTVSPTSASLAVGASVQLTASNVSGTLGASSSATGVASVNISGNVVTVRGVAAGTAVITVRDSRSSVGVPITVTSGSTSTARYSVIAWNDLGMHCMDGKDYSMFSILPPYNNLHAQLVNASTGKAITSGVTLSYEAVADPTGSINTSSAGKTNFWSWAAKLYGAAPAQDVGLTGNSTPSRTARAMKLDATNGWFEASGLPITPYDDTGAKNYYPTVKVTARDSTGKVLATTTTVLPVSDEITCVACHASRPATETNPARLAAKPATGWVNDPNAELDWKKNILLLHDQKQSNNPTYVAALAAKGMPGGMYAAALSGTPTLCASCHGSNALPGTGMTGISAMTTAQHKRHAGVTDPANMLTLDASSNRAACYNCHPGSVTKCLRGAMGDAVDAAGNAVMGCQSCHGTMSKVADPTRVGWLQEPTCQACHFNGKRTTSALDAAGNLVKPADQRFATNANVPAAGFNLFRFSKGHGGLQCEACHGATHAEYPSSHANDNIQSITLQGYAGTLRECSICHASLPVSTAGGPHGMHSIGQGWVNAHGDRVESSGSASCAYCHGADYRGTPLSQVKVARAYTVEGGTRSLPAGTNVGCYNCHNGPNP